MQKADTSDTKLKTVVLSQTSIIYYSQLKGGSLPLLMIHGHGGDHRGLMELAGKVGGTVYVIDLPGFGESGALEHYDMPHYMQALQEFADVMGFKKYHLLGHSLGSGIALNLAAEDKRVAKLVLLNPVPGFTKLIQNLMLAFNGVSKKIPERYSKQLVHAKLYSLVTFLLNSRQRRDIDHAKNYLRQQSSSKYSFKAWSESGEAIYKLDQLALAKTVSQPVLILHGDKDTLTSQKTVEAFAKTFQNAQLQRFKMQGHFMHMESISDATDAIRGFLS